MERHLRFVKGRQADATYRKRKRLLVHMHSHLPVGIDRASEDEIVDYFAAYTGAWSRYTYDTHARSYYAWCVQRELLTLNPMQWIPKPRPGACVPHPCSDADLAVALHAPAPYGRAILLASRAGLRCGEIARARADHIVNGQLCVLGKGDKVRTVPLDDVLLTELAAVTGPLLGCEVSAEWLTDGQRAVWDGLGLPRSFRLHAGRHWYATRLLEAGVDVRVVQELLGHASLTTTMGYLAVTSGRMAAAVARLPRVAVAPVSTRLDGLRAA